MSVQHEGKSSEHKNIDAIYIYNENILFFIFFSQMNRVNPSFMVGAQTLKNPWFKIKILETCSCHRNNLHRLKYRYHSRGIKGSKL